MFGKSTDEVVAKWLAERANVAGWDVFLYLHREWRKHVCYDPESGHYEGATLEAILARLNWLVEKNLLPAEPIAEGARKFREEYSAGEMVALRVPAFWLVRDREDRMTASLVALYAMAGPDKNGGDVGDFLLDESGVRYIAMRTRRVAQRFVAFCADLGVLSQEAARAATRALKAEFWSNDSVPLKLPDELREGLQQATAGTAS